MDNILKSVVFSNYTVLELLAALGAVAAAWVLFVFVRGHLGRSKSPHFEAVVCPDCGWKGRVSTYAGRCPRCNRPLGQQKARRR